MINRSIATIALLAFAGAAMAQDKPAEKPKPAAPSTPAPAPAAPAATTPPPVPQQPNDGLFEAPDGTRLPVVKKDKITLNVDVEDLRVGTGPDLTPESKLTMSYHITTPEGSVFDTTRTKKPITFMLQNLNIVGWRLGMNGMKVGGVRRMNVPYQLGFGEREIPNADGSVKLPAKSPVFITVEVHAVDGKDAQGQPYPPREKALSREEKPDGLIIEELRLGTGEVCVEKAKVVCHYRGVLAVDGQQFDASYDRGQPSEFSLDPAAAQPVIKGWQEGIPGMKVGGKRRLIIPAELAYGAQGRPGSIPPNSLLEFEVELVEIKK